MSINPNPERTSEIYAAIDAFQRTHRLPGLQHAQIRGLLAEHLARSLPAVSVVPPATNQTGWLAAAAFVEAMNEACDNRRPCESCTTREDVASELRRLAAEAPHAETPDEAPLLCDHCKQPGHSFEDCPRADAPAVVAQPGKETSS